MRLVIRCCYALGVVVLISVTTPALAQDAGTAVQGNGQGGTQVVPAYTPSNAPATQGSLTYQPLVGIPGVSNNQLNFNTYINQLYFLSISIAALMAVIKIILAGVKWMLTDIVTDKSEAKKDIWGALLGLLLIVSAVLILGTINPQLRELNVLSRAEPLRLTPASGGGSTISSNSQAIRVEQQNLAQSPDNQQAVNQALGANRDQVQTGSDRGGTNTFSYLRADASREARNGFVNACMNVTQGGVGASNDVRTETYNGTTILACYRQGPNNTWYRVRF
jgi:hypothetical protein